MRGELKDYKGMAAHCERLLEMKPDSLTALQGLAMVAFAPEDYEKAAEHCAAIVSYAPESFEGWFNLGLAYQKAQNHEKADELYSRAIRAQPNECQLYVDLVRSNQHLGA